MINFQKLLLFFLLTCILSCKKEVKSILLITPGAGADQINVPAFSTRLNADSLIVREIGVWSVSKGMVDSKVYFDDVKNPNTVFHGLPGENYVLIWTANINGRETTSSVNISFQPLRTSVVNSTSTTNTKFFLYGTTNYDSGEWTIKGKYSNIMAGQNTGTVILDLNSQSILFQGFANTDYKFTWTTHYGSKSASSTIDLRTGNYSEDEAIQDLQLVGSSSVVYDNNHVVGLNLSGSRISWILSDTIRYPSMQALTYLKRLDLSGSALFSFPQVIGDRFLQLEYLNMNGTEFYSVPDNIGNLTKLKTLSLSYLTNMAKVSVLPDSFGNLTSLEFLDLGDLGLTQVPESLGKLVNLKYLNLENNVIKKLPDNIGSLTKLEFLNASCLLDVPVSISNISNLKKLVFRTTASNAQLPDDFGRLQNLDILYLTGSYSTLPSTFGTLNVRDLTFEYTKFPSIPDVLGDLQKLESLDLVCNCKTLPDSFTNLTSLKSLVLGGPIETLPSRFGRLINLKYLNYSYGSLTELPSSIGQLKSLTELYLGSNSLKTLPSGLFDLAKIKIIGLVNNKLTSLPIGFSKLGTTLQTLYVSGNMIPSTDVDQLKLLMPTTYISTGL